VAEAKRVLVTGASRGIGRAIAQRLAGEGWAVAVHYNRNRDEALKVLEALGGNGAGLYQADLRHPEQARPLVDAVASDGPLHAVVNNAGVYRPLDFAAEENDAFEENWELSIRVNLESPVRIMRAVVPIFEAHGGGKILNVASRVGFKAEAGASLYAASKAALINVTRSLAVELAPLNIGMFGIAPGWVDTAMAREGVQRDIEGILATIPLGRMASPEDCAAVAAFLLSDEASYLSGQVIDINGASYFH
jgi:3-oxoacyl-[acyl-carrier protein] reductase